MGRNFTVGAWRNINKIYQSKGSFGNTASEKQKISNRELMQLGGPKSHP